MGRVLWLMLAVFLAMAGWELLLQDWLGFMGWLALGLGVGIAVAVLGSLIHDALVGPRSR